MLYEHQLSKCTRTQQAVCVPFQGSRTTRVTAACRRDPLNRYAQSAVKTLCVPFVQSAENSFTFKVNSDKLAASRGPEGVWSRRLIIFIKRQMQSVIVSFLGIGRRLHTSKKGLHVLLQKTQKSNHKCFRTMVIKQPTKQCSSLLSNTSSHGCAHQESFYSAGVRSRGPRTCKEEAVSCVSKVCSFT